MLNRYILVVTMCLLALSYKAQARGHSDFVFAGPGGAGFVSVQYGRHHRPKGIIAAGIMTGTVDNSCNPNPYSPYIPYWSSFPTSNYYNNSFGYWSPSHGTYGSYYTQPGMYTAYNYGPYNYSTSYLNSPFFSNNCSPGIGYFTNNYGMYRGLANFDYVKVPGQGYSLFGTGPYGNPFYYTGLGR
ncbi:MAG: hypothetical protein ACKOA8_00220 [Deltaproteobacteria bacterium]